MKIPPYPLKWPKDKPRCKTPKSGWRFKRTVSASHALCIEEIDKLTGMGCVMTSNLLALNTKPKDPGVCIWFYYGGVLRSIGIDIYDSMEGNMGALAITLEALRTIERHGGVAIFEQAIQGFASALPERTETATKGRPWWEILGVTQKTPWEVVEAAYRALAKTYDPDNGSSPSHEKMAAINDAFAEAKETRKSQS